MIKNEQKVAKPESSLFYVVFGTFPESACEGFFVKKQPLYYIFTSSHLLI